MRHLNYLLKQKIAKQQTAQGEVADPLGVSPQDRKALRKAFNKYDKDGSGNIDGAELKQLAIDLAEPFTDEEIADGLKEMDKSGTGAVNFEDFCNWIADERNKDEKKGIKMQLMKMKMRAQAMQSKITAGSKGSAFQYSEGEAVHISANIEQGPIDEGKTKVDLKFTAVPEAEGRAAMGACGAPGDAAACVCINVQLLPGVDASAEPELSALYDQIWDMVSGDQMLEEMGPQVMLHSKPTMKICEVDGVQCLQVMVSFTFDPFASFGVDSRLLKDVSAQLQWAHLAEELIKGPGEQLDILGMEGLKLGVKGEVDRKIVEWLSQNDDAKAAMAQSPVLGTEEFAPVLAAALCFGSADLSIKARSVQEIFNKDARESIEAYNEFLEEWEDKRMMDAEATTGQLTVKIVEIYSSMGAVQDIYKELKSKIMGPHSIKVMIPTAIMALDTQGLDCLHKFFPTPEEIEAHECFAKEGDDDEEEW